MARILLAWGTFPTRRRSQGTLETCPATCAHGAAGRVPMSPRAALSLAERRPLGAGRSSDSRTGGRLGLLIASGALLHTTMAKRTSHPRRTFARRQRSRRARLRRRGRPGLAPGSLFVGPSRGKGRPPTHPSKRRQSIRTPATCQRATRAKPPVALESPAGQTQPPNGHARCRGYRPGRCFLAARLR